MTSAIRNVNITIKHFETFLETKFYLLALGDLGINRQHFKYKKVSLFLQDTFISDLIIWGADRDLRKVSSNSHGFLISKS